LLCGNAGRQSSGDAFSANFLKMMWKTFGTTLRPHVIGGMVTREQCGRTGRGLHLWGSTATRSLPTETANAARCPWWLGLQS
jgi:hypothetical protein